MPLPTVQELARYLVWQGLFARYGSLWTDLPAENRRRCMNRLYAMSVAESKTISQVISEFTTTVPRLELFRYTEALDIV